MVNIEVKSFNQLSTNELYQILQLRSKVFVVEQDCVYQDVDGKDFKAFHALAHQNDTVIAYTRIFGPGDYFKESSIGRVVVDKNSRGTGVGYLIMNASISFIKSNMPKTRIRISAQTYLKHFYNKLGFKEVGEEYLEDGIPHINMLRE